MRSRGISGILGGKAIGLLITLGARGSVPVSGPERVRLW